LLCSYRGEGEGVGAVQALAVGLSLRVARVHVEIYLVVGVAILVINVAEERATRRARSEFSAGIFHFWLICSPLKRMNARLNHPDVDATVCVVSGTIARNKLHYGSPAISWTSDPNTQTCKGEFR